MEDSSDFNLNPSLEQLKAVSRLCGLLSRIHGKLGLQNRHVKGGIELDLEEWCSEQTKVEEAERFSSQPVEEDCPF